MKTLILGHEYCYKKTDIRCSPIDVDLWYDDPFDCVSIMCDKSQTDFVYDVYKSVDYRDDKIIQYNDFWVWKFALNNSYDRIVDCIGFHYRNTPELQYRNQDKLLQTISRVLTTDGKFYSQFGIYTKMDDGTLSFEPKNFDGYQYAN